MKLLNIVGWSSMAIIPKTRQTKPAGVIVNEHTLTASQTRLHVGTLSRWFDFIHYDELLDRLSRPRSRPFCLLTFDDGKRSNATITAPELERLGVPAVFYVTTRFLTDGFPLWFDRSHAIRRALGYAPPELDGETLKKLPFTLLNERLDRKLSATVHDFLEQSCTVAESLLWTRIVAIPQHRRCRLKP